jgi:hypothetical protein
MSALLDDEVLGPSKGSRGLEDNGLAHESARLRVDVNRLPGSQPARGTRARTRKPVPSQRNGPRRQELQAFRGPVSQQRVAVVQGRQAQVDVVAEDTIRPQAALAHERTQLADSVEALDVGPV